MDACVDPLVLQLEDEDARVRLATLEKLRKVAAVESVHFPVRNPRRFLQCLRRRALDENAEVAREARRLVVDVMPALGDDAEQILSSILPHLIPHLPSPVAAPTSGHDDLAAGISAVDDEVYRVLRKYVAVSNDLKSVAELLVNIGLAHGRASVREASLMVITRLLDERYLTRRKPGASSTTSVAASRMDKTLFVALLQATVPTLEDSDEGVVVAAEETIAKLQLYWGQAFRSEASQFLSSEDNRTLELHQEHISQFLTSAQSRRASPTVASMTAGRDAVSLQSSSSLSQSRLPLSSARNSSSLMGHQGTSDSDNCANSVQGENGVGDLMFGFVPSDVMDTLASSRTNSNADWKKRAVAVEQLFQLAKQAAANTVSEHVNEMDALFAALIRFLQDVDPHIVKRALQITQTLFSKLLEDDSSSSSNLTGAALFMLRLLHSLVETAASFADDKDVRMMAYAVLSQFFTSKRADVAQFQRALVANSLQSRRLQVREEALRVWALLLLSSYERSDNSFEEDSDNGARSTVLLQESLADETSIQVLGKLLGDTSVRVRDTAFETAAVLSSVTSADVYALLEAHVDDQYVAERIDWASLRRRLRQKQVPKLAQMLPMLSEFDISPGRLVNDKYTVVDKSLPGSSELQTMMLLASQTLTEKPRSRGPPIDRSSPIKSSAASPPMVHGSVLTPCSTASDAGSSKAWLEGDSNSDSWGSLSDRSYFDAINKSPRTDGVVKTARPGSGYGGGSTNNEEMADKLSALKKKASQLRRTTSVKRVVGESHSPTERSAGERADASELKAQRSTPARSKTSPERLAHPLSRPTDLSDEANYKSMGYSPRNDVNADRGITTRRQRTAVAETKVVPVVKGKHSDYYQQLSPQKQQDMQTRAVNHEDRPIRSRFHDNDQQVGEPAAAAMLGEDRPIRPVADTSAVYSGNYEYPSPTDNNEYSDGTLSKRKPGAAPAMSLATCKRLEAKQRQKELERHKQQQVAFQTTDKSNKAAATVGEYDDEGADISSAARAAARPISLATRKRLEAKAKQSSSDSGMPSLGSSPSLHGAKEEQDDACENDAAAVHTARSTRRAVKKTATQEKRSDESKPRGSALGSQEPRYLEPHELTPVANAKQEAAALVSKISRSDDWMANFEALTTVRRLAAHTPTLLEDKIHAVVSAVLAQVPNLRSTVSKNALLALESMCAAFGRAMDGEVDAVVPLLLKRCGDSNQFVCESASISLASVARHCSTLRVVSALSAHLTSRAVPIRREVARCMLTLLSIAAECEGQLQQSAAFSSILAIVGKCLEDSNNEVRDAAKQALLFLLVEQQMDVARIKKMLPADTAHTKLDQLVASKASFTAIVPRPSKAAPTAATSLGVTTSSTSFGNRNSSNSASSSSSTAGVGTRPAQASGKQAALDVDAFGRLHTKLNSSNWKDRLDALEEVSTLASSSSAALTSNGRVVPLFDVLVKRLDDGNAKVSALALERLGCVLIPGLGDGLAPVLALLLPALSKQLAASNARMAALALDALKALGAHVDARLLCQHLAPLARLGNARVKPVLVDMLAQLTVASDEKLQPALSRYVAPLALELLKEAKSEVKDANGRLLAALRDALGAPALQQAASKLSAALQDKLAAVLMR